MVMETCYNSINTLLGDKDNSKSVLARMCVNFLLFIGARELEIAVFAHHVLHRGHELRVLYVRTGGDLEESKRRRHHGARVLDHCERG